MSSHQWFGRSNGWVCQQYSSKCDLSVEMEISVCIGVNWLNLNIRAKQQFTFIYLELIWFDSTPSVGSCRHDWASTVWKFKNNLTKDRMHTKSTCTTLLGAKCDKTNTKDSFLLLKIICICILYTINITHIVVALITGASLCLCARRSCDIFAHYRSLLPRNE